ncbi:MAG: S53 family peptidase [Nitrospiraceae bacterium]|nr:S53 family peptidase [Nitrospiraceae bacterium]
MNARAARARGTRAVAALGTTALLVSGMVAASPAEAGQANTSSIIYQVRPIAINSHLGKVNPSNFPSPGECVKADGLACYTPAILHTAYQIPWTINGQLAGTGETVVIIDAYGSPTVVSDLATFDSTFGLPAAHLNVFYPDGKPSFNPNSANEVGWAEETSLDVQTVHSLAPGATIDLVVASSNNGNALNNAQAFAVDNHLGQVITESYGAPEAAIAGGGNNLQLQQAHAIYQQAATENISVFASSGDAGATNGYSTANALYPASDPYVTAAGGTDLFVKGDTNPKLSGTKAGTYASEYTWADYNSSTCPFGCQYGPFGATGGAPSAIFTAPKYQAGPMRTTSDVAFNASVYTATMIYLGFLGAANNNFYFFGGTSEASPSWAAITADIDQARGSAVGLFAPKLYKLASNAATYASDFHDITVGENNDPAGGVGFSAGKGYDLPTGLGTPIVTGLLSSLAPNAAYGLSMP